MASRRRDIDWDRQPLGEVSDYELAAMLKCSDTTVRQARYRRGIKAVEKHGKGPRNIDWDKYPLGILPDGVVGDMAGTTRMAALGARRARGISVCTYVLPEWNRDAYRWQARLEAKELFAEERAHLWIEKEKA